MQGSNRKTIVPYAVGIAMSVSALFVEVLTSQSHGYRG